MLRASSFALIFILLGTVNSSTRVLRRYIGKKDMVSGEKASQFSFYSGQAQRNLTHRIESYYNPMQKIDLRTYPHDEVIGRLDAQQVGNYYEARFELRDTRNKTENVWYTGLIKLVPTWFNTKYVIHLAERTITMKKKSLSSRFRLFDESQKLLALITRNRVGYSAPITYNMEIYSNQFLDSMYMLFIAAYDPE